MEQNRLKMAERETNNRGIEQLVTQLKAKVDSSQLSLDRAHLLGSSVGDLSTLSHVPQKYQSTGDLGGGFNLDRERIKYLEKRVRHLENDVKQKEHDLVHKDPESEQSKIIHQLNIRILDLEESLKEKDGIIDAKTKAASLITESLSLKGRDTVDLLEETKQEMIGMQQTFVATEDELNKRIGTLEKEIQSKDKKIANLEEVNDILETARFDLTIKNSELDSKTGSVEDYANKLNELNKINETLQHRIESLENEKDDTPPSSNEMEFIRKIQELESKISDLQSENDDLKKSLQSALNTPVSDSSDQERINNLEAIIAAHKEECISLSTSLQSVQDQLTEKTVEYNVLMANFNVLDEKLKSYGPKSLFSRSTDEEAHAEINKLNKQLDEANKTGIKTKLKMKQLQKQIDTLKKQSDSNKELVKLMDENQRLSDKLKELEADNTKLRSQQLNSAADDIDGEHNKSSTELEAKLKLLETTCQNQTSAIQLLEEQKLDMTADFNSTKTELTSLKGHIKNIDKNELTTQMDSIAYEERIEQCQKEIESLKGDINKLTAEKMNLKSKLDRYVNENMELLEKIDKLSKGSSVESIEILERLTQEEKLEMERFQHAVEAERQRYASESVAEGSTTDKTDTHTDSNKCESNESEASTITDDILSKIQTLNDENNQLIRTIDEVRAEKARITEEFDELKANNWDLVNQLTEMETEQKRLSDNIKEINEIKTKLEREIVQMKKERDLAVASKKPEDSKLHFIDANAYKTGIKNLSTELDNYRSAKDKNGKFNVSKKLARESKNIIELMESLLTSYNSCIEDFECYKAEIAGERSAHVEFERKQIELMAAAHKHDDTELDELKNQIEQLHDSENQFKRKCIELEEQIELKETSRVELEK